MAKILVTGAAGFIGFHVARRLLQDGATVIGLDNVNAYYDPALKEARLAQLAERPGFRFERLDLADRAGMERLFAAGGFDRVVHLAAQAGVRYSLTNPHAYIESNVTGFLHVLEGCRHHGVTHLVYASSSSVYGASEETPFSTADRADRPVSLYAATKRADELMAYTYAHLYRLPVTGLRFFTVYGPWGRPDMAYYSFTKSVVEGTPIRIFGRGTLERDMTYVDDVVEGIVRVLARAPRGAGNDAPAALYNIGNHAPVPLAEVIALIEQAAGRPAVREYLPEQPGDVPATYADVEDLARDFGFRPTTPIAEGIARFVEWYRAYAGVAVPSGARG